MTLPRADFSALVASLPSQFRSDLEILPTNHIKLDRIEGGGEEVAARVAYYHQMLGSAEGLCLAEMAGLAGGLAQKREPPILLHEMGSLASTWPSSPDPDLARTRALILALSVLSDSLREGGASGTWIGREKLAAALLDPGTRAFFLGLVHERIKVRALDSSQAEAFAAAFERVQTGSAILVASLSMVDIGAVAAFRLGDQSSEMASFDLRDIVSSGLMLVFALGDSPVSAGFGLRIGPSLSGVSSQAAQVSGTKPHQLLGFVGFDIPILPLYARR